MAERNIEKEFYTIGIPNENIQLSLQGAATSTINAKISLMNSVVTIDINILNIIVTANGIIESTLPEKYTLPSSISSYTFPVICLVNGTANTIAFTINAAGIITIYKSVSLTPFNSGDVVALQAPISFYYLLS